MPLPHHHRGPHPTGWISNFEEQLSLTEGAEMFGDVIAALRANGRVTIDGVAVEPPPEAWFTLRYEQMPKGELKLKLEIEWEPDASIGDRRGRRPRVT